MSGALEHWGVCDEEKDGKRAIAQLKDLNAGVQYGLVDHTGNDNTCVAAATGFNITDGHRIALRVCLRDGRSRTAARGSTGLPDRAYAVGYGPLRGARSPRGVLVQHRQSYDR